MKARSGQRVLLVGWRGADPALIRSLVERRRLPHLARLIRRGVSGALATPAPLCAPALWTSLVTGQRLEDHGVAALLEPSESARPGVREVSSASRRSYAIWNLLTHAGVRSNVVGWPVTHPAEPIHGAICSDRFGLAERQRDPWPLAPRAVHPPRLEESLEAFRVHPDELSDADMLGLASGVASPGPAGGRLAALLREAVALDSSVHAAATRLIEKEPWGFSCVHYALIERASRGLAELAGSGDASTGELALYRDALTGSYQMADEMLGKLVDAAGRDATVMLVSDHGFHERAFQPSAQEGPRERAHGFISLSGPGIRRGAALHGAHLLDVTPTLLMLFGLPVGNDMAGRALRQAFVAAPELQSIRSWEVLTGDFGAHGAEPSEDAAPWLTAVLSARRRAGEIPPLSDDAAHNRDAAAREIERNRALGLLDAGDAGAALPLLERAVAARAPDPDATLALARARHATGNTTGAWIALEALDARHGDDPRALLLRGTLLIERGGAGAALEAFRRADRATPDQPHLQERIGSALLALGEHDAAEQSYCRALALDPESAEAQHGLAITLLRQKRYEDAAAASLQAVGLRHFFPEAHFHLGAALALCGHPDEAIAALETCLALRPGHADAHRWLGIIHDRTRGDPDRAAHHRHHAARLSASEPRAS